MKKIFLTILFVVLAVAVAEADEWIKYATSENGTVYWHPSSVEKISADVVGVLVKRESTPEAEIQFKISYGSTRQELIESGYADFSHSLILEHVNCKARETALKSIVDYNKNGKIIASTHATDKDLEYSPVITDTIGDALYKIVCP